MMAVGLYLFFSLWHKQLTQFFLSCFDHSKPRRKLKDYFSLVVRRRVVNESSRAELSRALGFQAWFVYEDVYLSRVRVRAEL
jgi:hypothetical protein